MRFLLLSFSCAFLGGGLIRRVGASCYYPDGSFPSDYVYTACSGSEFTSCCIASEGDQCLSNGLCYYPRSSSKYLFRGACTDKTWKSENCFKHCLTGSSNSRYDRLVSCGDDRYCCYSDGSTCCNDDSKVFNIGNTTVIKDFATTSSFTLLIQTSTGLPKTTKPTSTGSTPATDPNNTAAPATATTSSTTTTTSTPLPAPSHGISKTIVIASATAGLLVLLAAVSLVWICLRRRYRKKLATGTNPQSFPMSTDGFQKLPDKTPRPVEHVTPLHSPAPPYQAYQPYQPPAYQSPVGYQQQHGNGNGAVEIDDSYLAPTRDRWGQPVYEAPGQMERRV